MKNCRFIIYVLLLIVILLPFKGLKAEDLGTRLSGKILLQVESAGQAWYMDPTTKERAFLGRPADAFRIMRELGLGISEKDFKLYNGYAPKKLSGKILLRVEAKGEAYYVFPNDLKLYYLGRPADAFSIMREKGLGITNVDLNKIIVLEKYKDSVSNKSTENITDKKVQVATNQQKETQTEFSKLDSNQIYKKIGTAIVYISTKTTEGTGLIYDKKGFVVTNEHLITGYKEANVKLNDGTEYKASLIGYNQKFDLAILKIDPNENYSVIDFGNKDSLESGDPIYAMGYSSGYSQNGSSITKGIFSRIIDSNWLESDIELDYGNSGGALINEYGHVIGITSYRTINLEDSSSKILKYSTSIKIFNNIKEALLKGENMIGKYIPSENSFSTTKQEEESIVETNSPSSLTAQTISTDNKYVKKDVSGVLLFQGTIETNGPIDLIVSQLKIKGIFNYPDSYFKDDWEELYLYKINSDGTETLLDKEDSLGSALITFSDFSLLVPKGEKNAVKFTVRGDVKSTPVGTKTQITLNQSGWVVKDSNKKTVSELYISKEPGHTTTVYTRGIISVDMGSEGVNSAVASTSNSLVGRIALKAEKEDIKIKKIAVQNVGTANHIYLIEACLYTDDGLSNKIGCGIFSADQKANININYTVIDDNISYLYLSIRTGDAITGDTIKMQIPKDDGKYYFEAVGLSTGEVLGSPFQNNNSEPSSALIVY